MGHKIRHHFTREMGRYLMAHPLDPYDHTTKYGTFEEIKEVSNVTVFASSRLNDLEEEESD